MSLGRGNVIFISHFRWFSLVIPTASSTAGVTCFSHHYAFCTFKVIPSLRILSSNVKFIFCHFFYQILQPDIWVCLWLQVVSLWHTGWVENKCYGVKSCYVVLHCATLCYVVLDEIFQSCNVVLLPVKSLRESVQLLPSKFEYSGPMDLTQVKNTFNQESWSSHHSNHFKIVMIWPSSGLVSVHNQENCDGGEVGGGECGRWGVPQYLFNLISTSFDLHRFYIFWFIHFF